MAFDGADAAYSILAGDATLTALLATYSGNPAIFQMEYLPQDAGRPVIHCPGPIGQIPLAEHMDGRHVPRETRDLTIYVDRGGDPGLVDEIADRVHALFYRNGARVSAPSWSGSGYTLAETDVTAGPFVAPTDETLHGRTLTVLLTYTS